MHSTTQRWTVAILAVGAFAAAPVEGKAQQPGGGRGAQAPRIVYDPTTQIPPTQAPITVEDGFTFLTAGDLIGPGRAMLPLQDPDLEKVANIVRAADAASANNEGSIFDLATFPGYPAAQNGGGNPLGSAAVAHDLKATGFDFLSKANNHAGDFGDLGLIATEEAITAAGLLFAGSGKNRYEARKGALLETPRGRVAFVSAASTFNPATVAGLAEGDMPDRPGISVLRNTRTQVVTAAEMEKLRELAALRPGGRGGRGANTTGTLPQRISVLGQTYQLGDKPGVTYTMNNLDAYEILRGVRAAKQVSDMTVFTIHAHETGNNGAPPDFLTKFYHMVIDAGADIVAAHGRHVLHGIEIYKGRPIFHDLGSFYFMMDLDPTPTRESLESMGGDMRSMTYMDYLRQRFSFNASFYESMIAVTEFAGGKVKEIRLYPLDLRHSSLSNPRTPTHRNLGVPRLADATLGRKILENVQRQSEQFGTRISIENNVGIIRVN